MDVKRRVYALRIQPQARRLLEFLVDHFGEYQSSERLVEALYANDGDGGPLGATNVVAQRLHGLRKTLAPLGLELEGRSHRGSRLKWASDTTERAA